MIDVFDTEEYKQASGLYECAACEDSPHGICPKHRAARKDPDPEPYED